MSNMKPQDLDKIFREKRERRRRLAALPLNEKVKLIEKLHELGRTMVAARSSLKSQKSRADEADLI